MAEELAPVRARIGLIIPSSNRLTEPQFHRFAPPGVAPHVTRLRMTGPHHMPLAQLLPKVAEAALTLADAQCDVIVFHCTGTSMRDGVEGERQILGTIEETTGRRATTTAACVLAAFEALGVRRVVLASPSPNAHEVAFLEQSGLAVLRSRDLGMTRSDDYITVSPRRWVEVVEAEADPRAEAYFIACTNTHSIDAIEALEARLGRPAVTSNQATLWYCLRACGLADAVPGRLGGLPLATPVPA